ncbi:hypothetical protein B5E80_11180 [Flavonifractor sp. An135]|nr:hypothetical protein [Flavonifractor sp. An135]OUQ23021.1 hypothetical protein B5E80_11180 [Flavonifractor sp. An135]
MNMKKIVATASALSLTAAVAIGGTLAWLQDSSNTITNTFTWGEGNNINLTLAETTGTEYTIVPGKEDPKDPTLTLTTETESYVYVVINNELADYLDIVGMDTSAEGDWTKLTGDLPEGITGDLYAYNTKMSGSETKIPVFTAVKYHNDLNQDNHSDLSGDIVITGFAVQASAGTTAQEAWNATFGA